MALEFSFVNITFDDLARLYVPLAELIITSF